MPVLFLLPLLWSGVIALALLITPMLAGLHAPDTTYPSLLAAGPATVPAIQPTATRPVATGPAAPDTFLKFAQGQGARPPGVDAFLDSVESHVLRLINDERRKAGRVPVLVDERLSTAARAHSYDMLTRGYFDHVSPEGLTPADRVAGVHRRLVGVSGENIWSSSGGAQTDAEDTAKRAMRGLMNSPGHRENILRETFTHVGIGAAGSASEVKVAQVFGGVRALLDADLPLQVRQGAPLTLRAAQLGAGVKAPTHFGLFATVKGHSLLGPEPIATAAAKAPPGEYRLQLYFPDAQGWTLAFGPNVRIEP